MVSVEFNRRDSVEALLRAGVIFKFEGGDDADPFVGSPFYAEALENLLTSIVDALRAEGDEKKADQWRELYRLPLRPDRWEFAARYCASHPRWAAMSPDARREWAATVAAPYRLSPEEWPDFDERVTSLVD